MLPEKQKLVPRLSRHARLRRDPLTGQLLLLYPEGALELEETAAAILDLCDGQRNVEEVISVLADRYAAPREEISQDVNDYLAELRTKGLLQMKKVPA